MIDLSGNEEMRYLGWKQPFAQLMLHGKQETRTWSTKYRGLVLITASLSEYNYKTLVKIAGPEQYIRIQSILTKEWPEVEKNKGYAIAVGRLIDCQPMLPGHDDICFVEYQPALWMHIYSEVVRIKPIKFIGAQGWRKLSPEFIKTIQLL